MPYMTCPWCPAQAFPHHRLPYKDYNNEPLELITYQCPAKHRFLIEVTAGSHAISALATTGNSAVETER